MALVENDFIAKVQKGLDVYYNRKVAFFGRSSSHWKAFPVLAMLPKRPLRPSVSILLLCIDNGLHE
jgi:hypothetical protein